MRYLANGITLFRIALAPALLLACGDKGLFAILYLLAGLSDLLDGAVARATHTQSSFGAKLDSIADLGMFGAGLFALVRWMRAEAAAFLPLVALILLIRLLAMAVAARKYHIFLIVHTWANKLTGIVLFAAILSFAAFGFTGLLWAGCVVALLSALEELAMHLKFPVPDRDRPSIFHAATMKG